VTDPVPTAVLAATQDNRIAASMLLGSKLEGGWTSPYPVGDSGTSFGPYQMHQGGLLTSLGLTPAQAENAATATKAMLPSYTAAANKIPQSLWNSNPEQAAEQAAVIAESPATDYYTSQGTSKVDAAWTSTTGVLGQSATLTSFPGSGVLSGIINFFSGNTLANLGTDIKSDAERVGLVIFGTLLILVGIVIFAIPAAKTAAKTAAEARFAAKGLGVGGGASAADIQRRQSIADRSLAIGEGNLRLKQQRENRLAGSNTPRKTGP